MPLIETSFEDAQHHRKSNAFSGWGNFRVVDFADRSGLFAGQRLQAQPLFEPKIMPSVKFDRKGSFFAMGSCFAREIERALSKRHVQFLSATTSFDDEPINPLSGSGAHASTYITKYHAFSIMNAFRWAFKDPGPFPDAGFVDIKDQSFVDHNSHITLSFLPLEEAKARRKKVDDYVRKAMQADVVLLTLGLCELWWDNEICAYLNIPPDPRAARRHPGRFTFRIPELDEIVAALEEIWRLFDTHGKEGVQLLCTVSPVALSDTFREEEDIVVANCLSKSLNRVAVEYWRKKHDNVHYFPSYEMAIYSDTAKAWKEDRRHPDPDLVSLIVNTFEKHFILDA